MSWNPYWRLPPSQSIEGTTNGGKETKESYRNFLEELKLKGELQTYTELLPTKITDDYGLMLFNELKPAVGGRRKNLRNTRRRKLKRKTRRNK
jgi:hypothetical protein